MTTAASSTTGPCQVVSRPMLRTTRSPATAASGLPGRGVGAGLERHAYTDPARGVERDVIAGVGMADHARRRVVRQHHLEATARGLTALRDDDDPGVDGLADADSTTVMDRHP